MEDCHIDQKLKQTGTALLRRQIHQYHLGPMVKLMVMLGEHVFPADLALKRNSSERRILQKALSVRQLRDVRCLLEDLLFIDPENRIEDLENAYYWYGEHWEVIGPSWRKVDLPHDPLPEIPLRGMKLTTYKNIACFPREVKSALAHYLHGLRTLIADVETFLKHLPQSTDSQRAKLIRETKNALKQVEKRIAPAEEVVKREASESDRRIFFPICARIARRGPNQRLPTELVDYICRFF
jgi:hypothetical protein